MKKNSILKYSITVSFEEIKLPPVEDILVIGSKSPQAKAGVSKLFEFLTPDKFEPVEMDDPKVEIVFINRKILDKINADHLLRILQHNMIPFFSPDKILNVDLKLQIRFNSIEME